MVEFFTKAKWNKISFSRHQTILNTLIHESQLRCYTPHTETSSLIQLLKHTLQNFVVSGTHHVRNTVSLRKFFVLQRVARESFLLTPSSRSQTLLRHFRACAFALQKRVAFPPYTVYRNSLKEHLWRKTRLFECCLRCYEPKHSVAWRFHPVCQLLFTSWPSICLTRSAGAVHRYRM